MARITRFRSRNLHWQGLPVLFLLSSMEIEQILTLLVVERDKLSRAIAALEGGAKRPGRPPKKTAARIKGMAQPASVPSKRKRKPMTAARRKAHSERMKAFWAARRKSAKS